MCSPADLKLWAKIVLGFLMGLIVAGFWLAAFFGVEWLILSVVAFAAGIGLLL